MAFTAKTLALLAASVLYWRLVGRVAGVGEPWDADGYWSLYYPLSLVLAAVTGTWFGKRGWLAGIILIFAQLPVIWASGGTGPLWAAGLLILCALALPAAALSALTGWLAARARSR